MAVLVMIGLLSGLFFSSTFILNRVMSLEGGHWVWSGSLRYAYMILMLLVLTPLFQGIDAPVRIIRRFFKHWKFWTLTGSVGFGGFYSLICFSADHAPGWVIAATWQSTIIATLVVLTGFGRSFPKKVWAFSAAVFAGVLMVNLSRAEMASGRELIMGAFPVLLAAFCYPTGNQLVWEAKQGHKYLPNIDHPIMDNPFNKVLLMSLGSIPFWLVLVIIAAPPPPSSGQLINTALVALFSGVVATSLFLLARTRSKTANELAAVDATQSSEVVFAMVGEILILNAPLPNGIAVAGIILVAAGLMLFIRFQESPK